MPTWKNDLPKMDKHMGFDLRRTPASAAIQATISCDLLTVVDTHFYRGRTQPCERPNCQACNEAIPYRTHAYVSAYDSKKHEHFIFECTAYAARPFEEYRKATDTLRGCFFHACRPKGGRNSRVIIETNTANLSRITLPDPPDLPLALCVIWRIPTTAAFTEPAPMGRENVTILPDRLKNQREQPDNAADPPTVGEILNGNGRTKSPEPAL